jgi:hypothetical protein
MAWEQRRNNLYYYRSRKRQGRVVRKYYGKGILAERAAMEDTQKRERRQRERAEQQHIQALDTETQILYQHITTLTKAAYLTAGFHQHHRSEWRKRRTHNITQEGDSMTITTTALQETHQSIPLNR